MSCGGKSGCDCGCAAYSAAYGPVRQPPRARQPLRAGFMGAIEAACTGKYADLVKNGIGGTLNQPCSNAAGLQLYCNEPDVTAWHARAWDLFTRVRRAWNLAVDEARGPIPPLVRQYIEALERDYGDVAPDGTITVKLPGASLWNPSANATAAAAVAGWCSRAACALELLDGVRGVSPPVETTPEHQPWLPGLPGFGGISLVVLAAVALWLLARQRRP